MQYTAYLVWIFIVLSFSCLHVVGVNIIDTFYFVGLNMFPHNRVSVDKEPNKDTWKGKEDMYSVCSIFLVRLTKDAVWFTDRPPQTYFLTSQTPATALDRRIAMTTSTMIAVLGDVVSVC